MSVQHDSPHTMHEIKEAIAVAARLGHGLTLRVNSVNLWIDKNTSVTQSLLDYNEKIKGDINNE